MQSFEYSDCDKRDKPQTVKAKQSWSDLKVKQKVAEMSNLVRWYPIMFGKYVLEGVEYTIAV